MVGQWHPTAQLRPLGVGTEEESLLFRSGTLGPLLHVDPCAVHQDVQRSEPGQRSVNEALGLVRRPHVCRDDDDFGAGLASDPGGHLAPSGPRAAGNDHPCPLTSHAADRL